MKAALYARVSTEEQAKNYSIRSQLEALHSFAVERGFEIAGKFADEGASGTTLDRPALNELREYVRKGMVEVVIIYDPDRLSRKLVHLMVLIDEFEKQKVEVNFVTQSMGQTPEDKMLFGMKGLFAEYERTKLLERTLRGKLRKAKEGKQPGGRPPYGYQLIDGKHEIYEPEAEVVRMVFDWLAKEEMALRAIQLRLNKLGVPTREGKRWWQRATLYRIVRDQTYVGNWYYNKRVEAPARYKENTTVQALKPKEQWVSVPVPIIVSRETFEAAQRQLERNAQLCLRNTKRDYLLTGLLVCGKCGLRMNARTIREKVYYCCNSKLGTITPNICSSRYVSGSNVETLIWDIVCNTLNQPELVIEQMKKRDDQGLLAHLQANLDRVCCALEKRKMEEDRMLEAYKISVIDLHTLKAKMDEIKRERAELIEEKLKLEKELHEAQTNALNEEKIYEYCHLLPTALSNLDFRERKQILQEVIDRIVIDGDKVTIYGIIPMPTEYLQDVSIELQSSKSPIMAARHLPLHNFWQQLSLK